MVFLTFDVEEFDNPFPCSQELTFDRQMEISVEGTERILSLLAKYQIPATFFCTATFGLNASYLVKRMAAEGHEVASHAYYHNRFELEHLQQSREALEQLTGNMVTGFRMPNMREVAPGDLLEAGYRYSSSLNPTFLPGKYNHFSSPRRIFRERALFQIPASVSPVLRIPLFWLSLHNFPLSVYKFLANATLKQDGYLNLYFHPWEFIDLKRSGLELPTYVMRHSGEALAGRLGNVIEFFLAKAAPFGRLDECAALFGTE